MMPAVASEASQHTDLQSSGFLRLSEVKSRMTHTHHHTGLECKRNQSGEGKQ